MPSIVVTIILLFVYSHLLQSASTQIQNKREVALARFGDDDKRELLEEASKLEAEINNKIVGQGAAAQLLATKVRMYIENFDSREGGPPTALHFIGFPGIGKSALTEVLSEKLPVASLDAQKYAKGDDIQELFYDLKDNDDLQSVRPAVLLIEEIDKVREISQQGEEATAPFFAFLNQLLDSGVVQMGGPKLDLSHVMVITTMNFPPEIIKQYSADALEVEGRKKSKGFYQFSVEDFEQLHRWMGKNKGAAAEILSKMFRSNTVGRFASNVFVMKHFSKSDYREIIELTVQSSIRRLTKEENANRKLAVSYTDNLISFFSKHVINPPLGARPIIFMVKDMMDQLVSYGMKADIDKGKSLDLPRKIVIDFSDGKALLEVSSYPQHGQKVSGGSSALTSQRVEVPFNSEILVFQQPDEFTLSPPPSIREKAIGVRRSDVIAARFPKIVKKIKGLAQKINSQVYGQKDFVAHFVSDLSRYLSNSSENIREPFVSILCGFPGIGKTMIAEVTAKILGLPLVRINLQSFSSQSEKGAFGLAHAIEEEIERARESAGASGKYILLLEEVDKIGEIDMVGDPKDRPAISVIKDLIDRGELSLTSSEDFGASIVRFNIRDSFTIMTMNFDGKIFDFKADPRLTTIEDMMDAWKSIKQSAAGLKEVLETMFRPDTISRFLPKMHVLKPLGYKHYYQVLSNQVDKLVQERFFDRGGRDIGQIQVKLNQSYKKYLLKETLIPSDGARYTAERSRRILGKDLEEAVSHIPKKWRGLPLEIKFKYLPRSNRVSAFAKTRFQQQKGDEKKGIELFNKTIQLNFPLPGITGKIPPERLETAAHEFGHAFFSSLLGMRVETISSVSPGPNIGGYVKMAGDNQEARAIIAGIYSSLGGRALERLILSEKPLDNRSVLDITVGPAMDIQSASMILLKVIFELGFDPKGGTLNVRDKHFWAGAGSSFPEISYEEKEKMGQILREMENFLVRELIRINPIEWYKEKILAVAREGILNEARFYEIIGNPLPGVDEKNSIGIRSRAYEVFSGDIEEKSSEETKRARSFRYGPDHKTAQERMDLYLTEFEKILLKVLHEKSDGGQDCRKFLKK